MTGALGTRATRRDLLGGLGAVILTGAVQSACGGTTEERRPLFGPTRTPELTATPTPSAEERKELLAEGVALPDLGFFIQPPEGWGTAVERAEGVALRIVNEAADSDASGQAYATILVFYEETAPPAPENVPAYLEATTENAPDRLAGELDDFALVEAGVYEVGHTLMAVVEFTYRAEAGARMHAIRALAPASERVFIIAATTLDSAWPAYQARIAASLASFTLLGQ